MWCPDRKNVAAPLYFGDLYLGSPPLQVDEVYLDRACWGDNQGRLSATGIEGAPILALISHNHCEVYRRREYKVSGKTTDFTWPIDPHEMMHASLELEINGVRWGAYEFGWKRNILLTHRPTDRSGAPRPAAGEQDYHWKYCRYILDRLPRLDRSAEGLTLKGGGVEVDLRRSDALELLAGIVMERFGTDEDRLAAATLLLCQQGVMVSSATGARISCQGDSLTALRVGAAFCATYGELLRDLVRQIEREDGRPFQAMVVNFVPGARNTFGWPHHWCAGAVYRDGVTLLDSELGVIYVNPGEGRLATIGELVAEPDLADISAYGLSEYFRGRTIRDFKVREQGEFWPIE